MQKCLFFSKVEVGNVLSNQKIRLKEKDCEFRSIHSLEKSSTGSGERSYLSTSQQLWRRVRLYSGEKAAWRLNNSPKDTQLAAKQGGFELNLSPKCCKIYANNFTVILTPFKTAVQKKRLSCSDFHPLPTLLAQCTPANSLVSFLHYIKLIGN